MVATEAARIGQDDCVSDGDYDYRGNGDSGDSDARFYFSLSDSKDTSSMSEILAAWANATNKTLDAGNGLLKVLQSHGHKPPKDSRTLMAIPLSN